MLKRGMLNAQGKFLLARTGHLDYLGITDAGFNIPEGIEVVDLAVKPNLPELLDVLDIIKKEIAIEKIFLADKIVDYAPELLKEYEKRFTKEKIEFIPDGQPFREKMKQCKGVFRHLHRKRPRWMRCGSRLQCPRAQGAACRCRPRCTAAR